MKGASRQGWLGDESGQRPPEIVIYKYLQGVNSQVGFKEEEGEQEPAQ